MSEPTADQPTFDPRFDPAFQPGFEPSQVSGAPPRVHVSAPPTATQPENAVLADAAAQPTHPDSSLVAVIAPAPSLARNPFVRALWIVSAVLVVAGIVLLRVMVDLLAAAQTSSSGLTSSTYQLVQAAGWGAPMLIVLGVATAISTLFLFAARSIRAAG